MIRYKSIKKTETGKKYELLETKVWPLGSEFVSYNIVTEYFSLIKGTLTANLGYRWDGPTGAIDSADFMEGSCLHDILCDAMEAGMLPKKLWKHAANEMRIINKREGMGKFRRQYTWFFVRFWGKIKPWHT